MAERLDDALGAGLTGVFAGGSWALGAYRPGRSDLDVAAVVDAQLTRAAGEGVAARVRHEALPCPATKLELVVYRAETAASPTADRAFELNVNTGRDTPLAIDRRGDRIADHWFPIDRSMLAQTARVLRGPPGRKVFARIPPRELAPVLAESIHWFREREPATGPSVLAACRALRFVAEERWHSKEAAGRWAAERGLAPANLVAASIGETPAVDPLEAEPFLDAAEARLGSLK